MLYVIKNISQLLQLRCVLLYPLLLLLGLRQDLLVEHSIIDLVALVLKQFSLQSIQWLWL